MLAGSAEARFKVKANFHPAMKECWITGLIRDAAGKPVHPAEIIFDCGGGRKTYSSTLDYDGSYMQNTPMCADYTITVTAFGKKATGRSGLSVGENEVKLLDFDFDPAASLQDAVNCLQIAGGMSLSGTQPIDHNGDGAIGLADAIYNIQYAADLRWDAAPQSAGVLRLPMEVTNRKKTVTVSKDTDGDGIDDWFEPHETDENGYLELDGLADGIYSLTAYYDEDGDGENDKAVRLENINTTGRDVNLKTVWMADFGAISGVAALDDGADPVGIRVSIPGTDYETTTGMDGGYTISNLPAGAYTLRVEKLGYGTISQYDVAALSGDMIGLETIVLPASTGSVAGNVTLSGQTDAAGILVSLVSGTGQTYAALTNAAGEFAMTDIPAGGYDIKAEREGFQAIEDTLQVVSGESTSFGPVQLAADITLGTVQGTITKYNRTNHSGILVTVAGSDHFAVTDSDGLYTITDVPAGTYTVFMDADGFIAQKIDGVEVIAGSPSIVDKTLYPFNAASETMTSGSIVGVARYLDQQPHAGINIKVEGTSLDISTDANGAFIIESVQAGTYTLTCTQANYRTLQISGVYVSPWGTTQVPEVVMIPKTGSIAGTITLEGTTDHGGVLVSVDGTSVQGVTDAVGNFILQPLLPGTYTLRFSKNGFADVEKTNVSVIAGETNTFEDPVALLVPPAPPTGTTAAYLDNTSVKVTWNISPSLDVAGYDIYYGMAQDEVTIKATTNLVTSITDGKGNYTVDGLAVGTQYWFGVKAVDNNGLESTLSATAQPAALGAFSGQVFLEGLNYGNWGDVTISLTGTTFQTVSNEYGQFLLSNIPAGVYTVRAFKEEPFVPDEITGFAVIPGQTTNLPRPLNLKVPPLPPTSVMAAQASASTINITWTASVSNDTAGYNVYYGTSSAAIITKANASGVVAGTSLEVTDLNKGVPYYFAVESVDHDALVSTKAPPDGSLSLTLAPKHDATVLTGGYLFNNPFDIVLTADGSKGYVSSRQNGVVLIVDFAADTPNVTGQINLSGPSSSATALALSPDGAKLYVVNATQSKLLEINTSTDTLSGREASVGGSPQNVVVSPDGASIYVCANASDDISIIDTATFSVDPTRISLNIDADPNGMVIAASKLYVVGPWSNKVYVIDLDDQSDTYQQVVDIISVGDAPYDAVQRSDDAYIYISHDTTDGQVSVIDTATGEVSTTITIKNDGESALKSPKGMAVAGDILYVVNNSDDTVTMISTATNTKLQLPINILSGGNGPENLVVSPDGGKLYIVHSFVGSVEILKY